MADSLLEELNRLRGKALCEAHEVGGLIAVAGSMAELYRRLMDDPRPEDRTIVTHLLRYETFEHMQHQGLSNHLIVCAYLLASHGDVDDCLLIWDAKTANFSTYLGLSEVLLVGAGLEETICFLRQQSTRWRWSLRSLFNLGMPVNKTAIASAQAIEHIEEAVNANRFAELEEKHGKLKRFCSEILMNR